ncbi:unnamed protein product, partial [Echinostoma caproni]|uniref:Integrase catalytic domain-containing protein n=1 Tax=Echinostoma caproni TaxID=27848 RepID=A0A183B3E8_9TREM
MMVMTDIFSRTWGEQFERAEVLPAPQLPLITGKHFERYLKKLRKVGILNGSSPHTSHPDPAENVVLKAVRSTTPSRQFPSMHQYPVLD